MQNNLNKRPVGRPRKLDKRTIGAALSNPNTILRRELLNSETRQQAREMLSNGFNPYDLTETTTMLHIVVERLINDTTPENLQLFFQASENIRKAAESVERIRASKAFTEAEYQNTLNVFVAIIELMPNELQNSALEMLSATKAGELKNVTPVD